jgi:hypothetical protein
MPQSNLFLPPRGFTMLNITAQGVIKALPGALISLQINAPGATTGVWAFNDCTSVAAISASNLIWQMAVAATANVEGAIIQWDYSLPFNNGLVITVPGGSPIASVHFA